MTEIAARELRNNTAGVLRRVEAGEQVTITSRGRPVAELRPVRLRRRHRSLAQSWSDVSPPRRPTPSSVETYAR